MQFFSFLHVNREEVIELAAVAVSKILSGPESTKWPSYKSLGKNLLFEEIYPSYFQGLEEYY